MSEAHDLAEAAADLASAAAVLPPELEPRLATTRAWVSGERIVEWLLLVAAVFSGAVVLLVIVFVAYGSLPAWRHMGVGFMTGTGWDSGIVDAYQNGTWTMGALPLILGTLITTAGSVMCAAVIGMGCAVFLAFLAPDWIGRPVQSVVRLMSGIPSVVFGLIGLMVIVPWIQTAFIPQSLQNKYMDLSLTGESLLAGIMVLTFMILPFFVTVATDSLRAIPDSYRLGGLALGLNNWRAITRLTIPPATPGLVAGLTLSAARAIGEAIAISMVAGALGHIPDVRHGFVFFLEPIRTLASAIVENGEGMDSAQISASAFALATILLVFSLLLSLGARMAFGAFAKRMRLVTDRTT